MLKQNPQTPPKPTGKLMDMKPGSEPGHADLPHDFGAAEADPVERDYASHAARSQDPGHANVRSNDERGGRRDAGVGVDATNAGAGSGGDVDANEISLGGGLAQNIPDAAERARSGADDAAAVPDRKADRAEPLNANDVVPRGGTVMPARDRDADGTRMSAGPDSMNTTSDADPYRDAANGEISRGESAGPADSSSSSAAS